MSPKSRRIAIGVTTVVLLIGAEIALNAYRRSEAHFLVTNNGTSLVSGIKVSFGGRDWLVSSLAPGETAHLNLRAEAKGPVSVAFRQKTAPLSGMEIPEFDPAELNREGQRFVVVISDSGFTRYQEIDESPAGRRWKPVQEWLDWFW